MNRRKNNFNENDIPKVFWKYFDLYRRQRITIEEYAQQTNLSEEDILFYLSII